MKFIYFQMIANTDMSGKFQISSKDIQIFHNNIRYLQIEIEISC